MLFTLTSLTSLSTIACQQQNNTFKIPLAIQENYVVQAINAKQNKQQTANFNPLTFNNILANPIITNSNLNSKNEVVIHYDIKIKQTANTFWNNNFVHRIPEISGIFTLNLDTNKISNNNINLISYLVGNYQNYINNVSNILTGSTNDFTLIMNGDDWDDFTYFIINPSNGMDGNFYLKNISHIYNPNIALSNEDWKSILKTLAKMNGIGNLADGYAACLHITKISKSSFQIVYTNLIKNDEYNMPLPNEQPWLPLFAFNSIKDWKDGSIMTSNNKFISINKDALKELIDIYTDNSYYHNSNWNIITIIKLLQNNHLCNTNLDLKTIATCLFNNWNINLVNNFLASNHEYFLMQYNDNNNYIKNNWNM